MKPSIGRIVHYVLSELNAEQINSRRVANPHADTWPAGAQAHIGNTAREGQIFPAMVTAVFGPESDMFNGQVFLDGNDSLWITSVHYDAEPKPGTWHWPEPVL